MQSETKNSPKQNSSKSIYGCGIRYFSIMQYNGTLRYDFHDFLQPNAQHELIEVVLQRTI